jgi:hypothetical protein
MFFFKSKTISNRQTLVIGFVLAVLAMLSMGVVTYVLPMVGAWLNSNGVTELDLFYTAFIFVFLMSTQALLLFGFPLYYAQDQKSHMTGFRILLATLLWMLVLMAFTALVFVKIHQSELQSMSLDAYPTMQDNGTVDTPVDTGATDTTIQQ